MPVRLCNFGAFLGTLGHFRSLFYTNIGLVKNAPIWPHLSLKVYGWCYMVSYSLIELPIASKYAGIEFGVVFEPLFEPLFAKICKKSSHFAPDGYFSLII